MAKEKYLVVKAVAGLGNRLTTICAAIEYCKKTNRTLFVDWADGQFDEKGMNAFNKFFELKNIKHILDYSEISNINSLTFYPEVWKGHFSLGQYDLFEVTPITFFQKFFSFGKRPHGYWKLIDKNLDSKNIPFGNLFSLNRQEGILFYSDFTPAFSAETFVKHIALNPEIELLVNSFASENKLNENCIGIHVRSTDKKPSQKIEKLFEKIKSSGLSSAKIFLATDSKEVSNTVRQNYSSVIEYKKFYPELKTEGMHQWALYNDQLHLASQILEQSIIDMWLLSKCEYLYCQRNSTFSAISKILHPDKTKITNWDE